MNTESSSTINSIGQSIESGTAKPGEVPQNKKPRKGGKRAQRIKPEDREFIAWDGEGQNLDGIGKPQSYTLFGCSTGDRIKARYGVMPTIAICKFILDVGRKNPSAIHVGFAFNYDVNMIVKSLSVEQLTRLYEKQYVNLYDKAEDKKYVIRVCRSKWLTISEHDKQWKPRKSKNGTKLKANYTAKTTVKIYDIFSFFSTSFVKAVRDMLGDSPELAAVEEGKKHRGGSGNCDVCGRDNDCVFDSGEYVERYWEYEIKLLAQVATELRKRFYDAGLKISHWYGPGALASHVMKREGIKGHMADPDMEVKRAAQFAYAGGRFELFKVGRIEGPIYSYDINSAYPAAIALLPSLAGGQWRYVDKPDPAFPFSVHNVRLRRPGLFPMAPGPLFYRDRKHCISYPWIVEGWYWFPEIWGIMDKDELEYLGGWQFEPADDTKPFQWVHEMYDLRREWKAAGNPNQMALKLTLNSMYGKMAQRVGWTEEKQQIPPWHQLEWAGWVTSYTRARLWNVMRYVSTEKLIAVETDGFYTTATPEELGLNASTDLGGWEIETYDEMLYFQSGLAWCRKGSTWIPKRRGLDAGTFELDDAIKYARSLGPIDGTSERWKPYKGQQTRFIGLGAALATTDPKANHCVWVTSDKEILPGAVGKRVHVAQRCRACIKGMDAYDMAHDLVVNVDPTMEYRSQAHYVPWLGKDEGDVAPPYEKAREIDESMIEL